MPESRLDQIERLFDELGKFQRPDFIDNAGDPWNGKTILPYLPPQAQKIVLHIYELGREIITRFSSDGEVVADRKGINALSRRGIDADFGPDQYDWDRNVGFVRRDDRYIDLSDPYS